MYPVSEVVIASSIPASAAYWVPKPSDVEDEGFGHYFRDVWPLVGVRTRQARALIDWERRAVEYVAPESDTEERFEALAEIVEGYSPDADERDTAIPDAFTREWTGLSGLDLGVAVLAHAFSNAGSYPIASCRAHIDRSWSSCSGS